ncbi:MAG: asparagine synthase (glutamine-hydrolyzing) [Planctomycetota bacterium]
MCGLCGIIGRVEPGDAERVRLAKEAMRHRGPDGDHDWSWVDASSGLGAHLAHLRLSIIDLNERADQPMVDGETGVALVFNGEIYNFQDLRGELESAGERFETTCDTEVILRGYLRWGEGVVPRLRGMFSIVIVDPRTREALLARDGFGIKPLYVASVDGGRAMAFASEVRALLASDVVEPRTDAARVHRYVWNGFVAGPETLVVGVDEFPRGSVARVSLDRPVLEPERYWHAGGAGDGACSAEDAEAAIGESVRAHLIADVPVGVFLSGGIDSSAVAALAVSGGQSVRTLSIGFDVAEADETKYARAVADAIGSEHSTIVVTAEEMLRDMDAALAGLDQPTLDGVNSWFVSRAAVQAGLKVALAGSGGDELLGGYTSFRRLPTLLGPSSAMGWLGWLTPMLAGVAMGVTSASRAKLLDVPAAGGRLERLYQTQYAMLPSRGVAGLIDAPAGELDPWGLRPERLEALADLIRGHEARRAVGLLESELFLGDRLLRDTDAVSMDHSLEVRVPLVDTVLSGRLAGMTPENRYEPVGSKPALRSVAMAAAGRETFERAKRGFEFPFDAWLRGPLREAVSALLLDRDACEGIGLDGGAVSRLWERFIERPGSVYWTRVWSLYVLLRWSVAHGLRR